MSRLPFAPKAEQVEIYDVPNGLGAFVPVAEKPVSFAALHASLKKAGYQLDSAYATVGGTLGKAGLGWQLVAGKSRQTFELQGSDLPAAIGQRSAGDTVTLTGKLLTATDSGSDKGKAGVEREILVIGKAPATGRASGDRRLPNDLPAAPRGGARVVGVGGKRARPFAIGGVAPAAGEDAGGPESQPNHGASSPIRTAGPGLTVYRGGMVIPRLSFTTSRVDDIRVTGSTVGLMATYTPTPHVQLEADIPLERRAASRNGVSQTATGIGVASFGWKYRFFREVWKWGDRQASVRLGADLPAISIDAGAQTLVVDPYVARQWAFENGPGLRAGLNASQANRRVIIGLSAEGVLRASRDQFRAGHEFRVSSDLEYVLLPLRYRRATRELFFLLETAFARHGSATWQGGALGGSAGWEYTIAPGLQYVMSPRMMLDASFQVPVARGGGDHILRLRRNLLLAVRRLW